MSKLKRRTRRVLARHAPDQVSDLTLDAGSARLAGSRLPTPVEPKPLTMPGDDGFRFDQNQGVAPRGSESQEPGPEHSITGTQLGTLDRLFQDSQLLT